MAELVLAAVLTKFQHNNPTCGIPSFQPNYTDGAAQSPSHVQEQPKMASIERNNESRRSGKQGFASMDKDKQREIASKGGHAAHLKGTAHEFTSEEARAAGRKGGEASHGGRGRNAT